MTKDIIIYNYKDVEVTLSGGGFEIIIPSSLEIQEPTATLVSLGGADLEVKASDGRISLGGPMRPKGELSEIDIEDVIKELKKESVTLTIGEQTYSNCKCVGGGVSVGGSPEQGIIIQGTLQYTYAMDNELIPATVSITGSEIDKLFLQGIQVQEQRTELVSIDGVERTVNAGPGQITCSGILIPKPDGASVDEIISAIGSISDINIGEYGEFKNCRLISTNFQVQGTDKSTVYITGSLTYVYDLDNELIPAELTISNEGGGNVISNIFIQGINIQEPLNKMVSINGEECLLPSSDGAINFQGIVVPKNSTDKTPDEIYKLLHSLHSISIGSGEDKVIYNNMRCNGVQFQVSGENKSVYYISGSVSLSYRHPDAFTAVSLKIEGGATVDLFVQGVSIQKGNGDLFSLNNPSLRNTLKPDTIAFTGLFVVRDSGIISGVRDLESILENLEDEPVTINIGDYLEYPSCRCESIDVSVAGNTESGYTLNGRVLYTGGLDNNFTPVRITMSNGESEQLYVQEVSVGSGSIVHLTDGSTITRGDGSISFSGIIKGNPSEGSTVNLSGESLLAALSDEYMESITIGGTEYHDCRATQVKLIVQGEHPGNVQLQGGITWSFRDISGSGEDTSLVPLKRQKSLDIRTRTYRMIRPSGLLVDVTEIWARTVTVTVSLAVYTGNALGEVDDIGYLTNQDLTHGKEFDYRTGVISYQYNLTTYDSWDLEKRSWTSVKADEYTKPPPP